MHDIKRCLFSLFTIVCECVHAELAVDVLHEVAPRELGKVDMYWASEVSR